MNTKIILEKLNVDLQGLIRAIKLHADNKQDEICGHLCLDNYAKHYDVSLKLLDDLAKSEGQDSVKKRGEISRLKKSQISRYLISVRDHLSHPENAKRMSLLAGRLERERFGIAKTANGEYLIAGDGKPDGIFAITGSVIDSRYVNGMVELRGGDAVFQAGGIDYFRDKGGFYPGQVTDRKGNVIEVPFAEENRQMRLSELLFKSLTELIPILDLFDINSEELNLIRESLDELPRGLPSKRPDRFMLAVLESYLGKGRV